MAQHAPDLLEEWETGLSDWEISEAEDRLGMKFPDDYSQLLGITEGGKPGNILIGNWELLSLAETEEIWFSMRDMVDAGSFGDNSNEESEHIKGYWWHEEWLPIAQSGTGHFICLDLDPASEGSYGQIIVFFHDQALRLRLAPSLKHWMNDFISGLEQGIHYRVYDEELDLWEFNNPAFIQLLNKPQTDQSL